MKLMMDACTAMEEGVQAESLSDDCLTSLAVRSKADEEAFDALLHAFQPLIRALVRQTTLYYETSDEVEQVMCIELWYAVQSFDERHGTPFRAFAAHCLRQRYKSWTRSRFYTQRSTFHRTQIRWEAMEGPVRRLAHTSSGDLSDVVCRKQLSEVFRAFIQSELTELEQRVFWLWYANYSYQEICEEMNTNKKAVDNALLRVKRKIRQSQVCAGIWQDTGF